MKFPRQFRTLAPRLLLLLAGTALALPALGAEMGVGCGAPGQGGWIRMSITIARPTLPDGTQVAGDETIEMQITAPRLDRLEDKAEIFRLSLPPEFEGKIKLSGEGTEVWATGLNGWRVASMSIFGDETNEPDANLSYVTPTDELALCSLSGVASGLNATGAPGRFALNAGGHAVMVPTAPGMPAQIVEQQVFSQLMAQGAVVRFASLADLGLLGAVPTDGSVLVIEGLDATGLAQQLSDTGLSVDVAGLASPPLPPADPRRHDSRHRARRQLRGLRYRQPAAPARRLLLSRLGPLLRHRVLCRGTHRSDAPGRRLDNDPAARRLHGSGRAARHRGGDPDRDPRPAPGLLPADHGDLQRRHAAGALEHPRRPIREPALGGHARGDEDPSQRRHLQFDLPRAAALHLHARERPAAGGAGRRPAAAGLHGDRWALGPCR